ncbi:bifunctional [glutamate--ammonia ligase]-adenylyl-L-tyrosine phosphorylase/[glutamate--ammonia-ligase] adenylyltransferase [Myxococcota bacterium]
MLPLSSPQSPFVDALPSLAFTIDAERAREMVREDAGASAGEIAVLLATAFPPMRAVHAWQHTALAEIAGEGWRVPRERSGLVARMSAALADPPDVDRVRAGLRRLVWSEKARIALREVLPPALGGAPVNVTAGELSHLADAAFEVALAEACSYCERRHGAPQRHDGQPSCLVMIALGKLGGRELNAGSDLDVMFLYDTDEGGSELSLHDHWSRVVRRAVATIESPTEDGVVWRVDLRLRPEGSSGPVVNSLSAAEDYYETWGRLWERAALLRARPAAGDLALGEVFRREIAIPFVYRRSAEPAIAPALAELVERSRAELCIDPERDLKLGQGGIRELEFFVQALQLIWGGREASLRVTPTLEGLARLQGRGLVTDREVRELDRAYRLLRSAEHFVQWMAGYQTHLLPESQADLTRLSRLLGFRSVTEFTEALIRTRGVVHDLFKSLVPETPARTSESAAMLDRLERQDPAFGELVAQWCGADIGEHLQALARRPDGLLGALTRERYPELASRVLAAIRESPDPEQAARYLRSFFGRIYMPAAYVVPLAVDPRAVHRLLTVLGASTFVGDAMVARPDLADIVLGARGAHEPNQVVGEMLEGYRRSQATTEDVYELRERFVAALRLAKQATMVSVAVADLAGEIEMREATRLLAQLADVVLDQSVRFELGGDACGLAVIAMGKLGGQDIGYGSDLDVIFVYAPAAAPEGQDAGSYFARSAQRVIRLISEPQTTGPGYDLDVRLRPSGSSGLLVTSLRAFARYHGVAMDKESEEAPRSVTSGAAWERQALLRARPCAGDRELGERVLQVAHIAAYQRGAPPVEEMHRLRTRMERELGRERSGRFDLKTGRGGLLDIEFATQWLQMRHGVDVAVRAADTWVALEALESRGYLSRAAFETLRDGYLFLRRLEQRMQVVRGASGTRIEVGEPGLEQLARRMGLADTARSRAHELLLAQYRDVTHAVRQTYLEVLGLPESTEPV